MDPNYNPQDIETKWQKRWADEKLFETEAEPGRKKYYVLEMLPYPSGDIHMGHVRNYSIGDALARYMWMKGHTILHPIGWDAFGLPAENAAIKRGRHPSEFTFSYIDRMRGQLQDGSGDHTPAYRLHRPPSTGCASPPVANGPCSSRPRCETPSRRPGLVMWFLLGAAVVLPTRGGSTTAAPTSTKQDLAVS